MIKKHFFRFCGRCNERIENPSKFQKYCPHCQKRSFKNGVTIRTNINRKIREELIKEKDGCEICHTKDNLIIHHKKRVCAGGTNEVKNLMVLCKRHHKMIHGGEFK